MNGPADPKPSQRLHPTSRHRHESAPRRRKPQRGPAGGRIPPALGILTTALVLLGACAGSEEDNDPAPTAPTQNGVSVQSPLGDATVAEAPSAAAPILVFDTCAQIDALAEGRGVPSFAVDPLEELGWAEDYSGWECGQ